MIKISIQKIPTGLKIMFSEVGPSDALAAKPSSGRKLNERNVNKKMLSLNKMFMYPLFHCVKTTNIYSKENNDK